MKDKLSVLGLGFSGLDIINANNDRRFLPGGTCANVLSVLAFLGWRSVLVKAEYSDGWNSFVDRALQRIGVEVSVFKSSKKPIPRVIQMNESTGHKFLTICPVCYKNLMTLELPSSAKSLMTDKAMDEFDLIYYDRVSAGIKDVVQQANKMNIWTFYEPNSFRSFSQTINNMAMANIVKFSLDRIPYSAAQRLLSELSGESARTRIILCTNAEKGIFYSIKRSNGNFDKMEVVDGLQYDTIIDTSGAGDWLSAGFINTLIRGKLTVGNISHSDLNNAICRSMPLPQLCCSSAGALGYFFPGHLTRTNTDTERCQFCGV